jgi:hypothetical protein
MGGVAAAMLLLMSRGTGPGFALADWSRAHAEAPPGALAGLLDAAALRAAPGSTPWSPPPCIGDTCQPRVSIPGYEPRIDLRGKRTEFFVSTLERLDVGAVTSVARSIALSGVRLDYQPPQAQDPAPGRGGAGRFALMVRWRLDSWLAPVWAAPRSP